LKPPNGHHTNRWTIGGQTDIEQIDEQIDGKIDGQLMERLMDN
jgi:hypothetical protein